MSPALVRCGLAALLAVSGMASAEPAPAAPDADPNAIRVLLAPAVETTLVSPVAARIAALNVGFGERFPRGRILVAFDCAEQAARLEMADAEFASARENHEAKLRLQGLQQAGELEVTLAANAVAKARAQIGVFKAQLAQCAIAAPFAGRVVKLAVHPHQGVSQGQQLLDIVGDGALKLRVNAPAKWVAWLSVGTRFEVQIDETGKRYGARVSALNGRVDSVSQTIELEATMDGTPPELLPGMSGTAHFAVPGP